MSRAPSNTKARLSPIPNARPSSEQPKPLAGKVALPAEKGAKVYVTGSKDDVGHKVTSDAPNTFFVRLDRSSIRSTYQGAIHFLQLIQAHENLLDIVGRRLADSYNAQMKRYAVSKLAQMLWMSELQAHLNAENANISCITANPGAVCSEGARARIQKEFSVPLSKLLGDAFLRIAASSPEKAAFSAVWAASAPDVRAEPQKYRDAYVSRKGDGVSVEKWTGRARDKEARKDLRTVSERLVAEKIAPLVETAENQ
ncbi:hypothetical protein AURDEDRAFT_165088 [Auricularia subglabra TFB-10046 SS5]|nr:hypothetical protein AURDEDRAFT_165088 [Auricularia subglabra TFB-10046 SS5]